MKPSSSRAAVGLIVPAVVPAVIALAILLAGSLTAQSRDQPVRKPSDPGIITTRQAITPAGVQSVFEGRVYGVAFGASSSSLWLDSSQVNKLTLPGHINIVHGQESFRQDCHTIGSLFFYHINFH